MRLALAAHQWLGRILRSPFVTLRAAARSAAIVALNAALLVAVTVSLQSRGDVDERRREVKRHLVSARAHIESTSRDLKSIEDDVTKVAARAADDHSRAHDIDVALVRIEQLHVGIDKAARDLRAARSSEDAQRATLDQLLRCRDALDEATRSLRAQPPNTTAATASLHLGTAACTAALDLTDGPTGAVHPYDFADPSVIEVGGTYFAFGTNGPAGTVQVISSTDLEHWKVGSSAIRQVPGWATSGYTWAPSVHRIGARYVMYYSVLEAGSSRQCISIATSATAAGPYVDRSAGPLVCQRSLGGSIDPDMYTDDHGFMHLTWKSEGNASGRRAQIWSQYLSGDGTALLGTPYLLLTADQPWQDNVIENPSIVRVGSSWMLFYSANQWNTDRYATGYATCTTENGPCAAAAQPVLLESTGRVAGPGGAQVFRSATGTLLVAYAAWDRGHVGTPNIRRLHIATLSFRHGRPVITDRS